MAKSSAQRLRKLHGILTLFWIANFPVVTILYFFFSSTWQKISIFYLVIVSIYANVGTEAGAWQASRAEVKVDAVNTDEINANEINTDKINKKS